MLLKLSTNENMANCSMYYMICMNVQILSAREAQNELLEHLNTTVIGLGLLLLLLEQVKYLLFKRKLPAEFISV